MNGTDTEQPVPGPEDGQSPDSPAAEALLAAAEGRAEQHRARLPAGHRRARERPQARRARSGLWRASSASSAFAADLLPVVDTLGLAVESAATADAATLAQGQDAVLRLLLKAFERAGLEPVDPAGQPFDPSRHEAMAMQPSAEHPAHTVLQVVQQGWILNGRLLRPARVVVSAEPAAPETPPGG